jgi:hypothetical protein
MVTKKETRNLRAGLSEGAVKELAENIVRVAISEQARDLEKHLQGIHERLVALERSKR